MSSNNNSMIKSNKNFVIIKLMINKLKKSMNKGIIFDFKNLLKCNFKIKLKKNSRKNQLLSQL